MAAINILPKISGPTTKLAPVQIDLRTFFSVADILKSRGFNLTKKGEMKDLIIPSVKFRSPDYEDLLECFNDKEAREQIGNYVLGKGEPTNELAIKISKHPDFINSHGRFTKTFEWYIGEALVRFFNGFSFAFGATISNVMHNSTGTPAGDYDTLVVMRNLGLLYIECKTGGYDSDDIRKGIDKAISLNCECIVFVVLSLGQKHLNKLEDVLYKINHPLIVTTNLYGTIYKIGIKNNSESTVYEWRNCFFVSASKDFIEQMKTVLRFTEAKRVAVQYYIRPNVSDLNNMGYQIEKISSH